MDTAGISPRVAVWIHNTDTNTWKLWLVPPKGFNDKRAFYRKIADILSSKQGEVAGLEVSDTEMVPDSHPAMKGLGRFLKVTGLASVFFTGNRFNGYYLPDGIILRSDL